MVGCGAEQRLQPYRGADRAARGQAQGPPDHPAEQRRGLGVKALQTYYDAADQIFTLELWGDTYAVQFERPDGLNAEEVLRQAAPGPDHYYTITIKLFEVEQA